MKPFLRSLQFRIIWIYVLISMLIIGVIGSVLYAGISQIILNNSIQSTQMAITKSGTYVEMYVDRLKVLTTMLARNPQTIRTLSSGDKTGQADVLQLIDTVLESDPYIKSVIVIGKDGYVLSNEKKLNMMRSSDMMKEPWYAAAVQNNTPTLTSARMQKFSMDKDNWVISLSQEMKDDNDENVGVVLLDIEYKGIEDYLNKLDLGSKGYAFIMNSRDEVVYHKDVSYFVDRAKQEQLRQVSLEPQGYSNEHNLLLYHTQLNNSDWTLVGVSSLDGLQQVRNQLLKSFFTIGVGLLLLIFVASPWIAGSITRPIKRLEQAMQKVKGGMLGVSVPETGVTEVQGLAEHFNSMVMEIRELMSDIEKKERSLRMHELSVLHSQINPHFLYNTLDTIVWMAEFNDVERVISTTKALASFFQLSLNGGKEFTTIAKEFDHVSQYLFIQKERYGNKLSYETNYDLALSDTIIPKIILQPLVENAIYHGIREKEGPGRLEMTCERNNSGNIVIRVVDNGVGFDPQDYHSAALPKLGGIGIRNVNERLKLYYGEEYGITIESEVLKGTTVQIVIPYK